METSADEAQDVHNPAMVLTLPDPGRNGKRFPGGRVVRLCASRIVTPPGAGIPRNGSDIRAMGAAAPAAHGVKGWWGSGVSGGRRERRRRGDG